MAPAWLIRGQARKASKPMDIGLVKFIKADQSVGLTHLEDDIPKLLNLRLKNNAKIRNLIALENFAPAMIDDR